MTVRLVSLLVQALPNRGHRRCAAVAALGLALASPARALTIGPGESVCLVSAGHLSISGLVLAGGNGYLCNTDLTLTGTTALEGGMLRPVGFGSSGVIIRATLDLAGPTVLSGSVLFNGGYPGDSEAMATTNHGLLRQTDAGALALWTLSSFTNLGTYQIENDLGIRYQDVWAALEHRDPHVERFTNTGTFSKIGGSGHSIIDMAFDNRGGEVLVTSGSLRLQAGGDHRAARFSASAGAALELGGQHTLTGGNVFDGSTRVLADGTLRSLADSNTEIFAALDNSGTVALRDGSQMLLSGPLRNMAGGMLVVGSAGGPRTATLQHDTRIVNDAGGSMLLNGRFNTNNGGSVFNAGTLEQNGAWTLHGTLDNAAGGVVLFNAASETFGTGRLSNAGVVVVAAGAQVTLGAVTQTAGRLTLDGTLDTIGGDVSLFGGVLDGNGSIQGNLVAGGASVNPGDPPRVYPGHSPGQLQISGSFRLLAGAELQLQVERLADGSLAWDGVSAGSFSFEDGSRVHVVVGTGVVSAQWQSLALLDCGSGCSFASGVHFSVDGAPGATLVFSGNGGLNLALAPAVPEPAAVWLALAGLGLLAASVRPKGTPA